MKNILLVLSLAAMPFFALSQVKLLQQTHGFVPEAENPMLITKYMEPGNAGRNVTWDFRDLEIGNGFVGNINQTLNTKCYGTFSESNVVLEEFGSMFAFRSTAKSLEQVGFMTSTGSTIIKYNKPFVKMRYPFTYKNSFSGEFEGDYIVNDKHIGTEYGVYSVVADAKGTLLLPANRQLNNVLRVKEIKNYDLAIGSSKSTVEIVTYRWYIESHRFPVLVLIKCTYFASNGTASNSTLAAYNSQVIQKPATPPSNNDAAIEISQMNVFPNPFKDELNIKFMLNDDSNVNLAIYDITGRVVKELYNGRHSAGEAKFTFSSKEHKMGSGTYIVRLIVNGKELTKKIIGN